VTSRCVNACVTKQYRTDYHTWRRTCTAIILSLNDDEKLNSRKMIEINKDQGPRHDYLVQMKPNLLCLYIYPFTNCGLCLWLASEFIFILNYLRQIHQEHGRSLAQCFDMLGNKQVSVQIPHRFVLLILIHRVPKKLSRFVFVKTSSNFHQFR